MKTITELKQDLIEHLATIDKTKLNMMDLNAYVTVLKMADDMMKPDPYEYFKTAMGTIHNGRNDYVCCATGDAKAGVVDG